MVSAVQAKSKQADHLQHMFIVAGSDSLKVLPPRCRVSVSGFGPLLCIPAPRPWGSMRAGLHRSIACECGASHSQSLDASTFTVPRRIHIHSPSAHSQSACERLSASAVMAHAACVLACVGGE